MEANNWKPGDTALCVKVGGPNPDSDYPPLRLNYEYIVNKVSVCGDCGAVALDVGLSIGAKAIANGHGTKCECGAMHSAKTGIHWCASWRFVKKTEAKATETEEASIEEQIEEAIKHEDYELAHKLSTNKD